NYASCGEENCPLQPGSASVRDSSPPCPLLRRHIKACPDASHLVNRSKHAAEPPTTRRAARRLARTRRGEIRGGLLLREVRRYACIGHGHTGGPPATMAERPGARLGDSRIWDAAARDLGTHAQGSVRGQTERPHCRDPAPHR